MSDSKELIIKNPTPLGSQVLSGPGDVLEYARVIAKSLAEIVETGGLYTIIKAGKTEKKYTHVEGWTTMLAMIGVTPREVTEEGRRNEDGSYTAVVELVRTTDSGVIVIGKASAICGTPDEPRWAKAPEYARKSMAITRATSKAARTSFSWIMILAGFAATPWEEMDGVIDGQFTEKPTKEYREPYCYDHGDKIPLVWREGESKDGQSYAFWGCRHWSPDGGCMTTSNAPGPNDDYDAMYWNIIDTAMAAQTDLTSSVVEAGFSKALFGEQINIKDMNDATRQLVLGYWSIVAERVELPESEYLGAGDKYRNGRKAFAKQVIRHALEANCTYDEAYEATCIMLEAGDLIFAKVGKRNTLDLVSKGE